MMFPVAMQRMLYSSMLQGTGWTAARDSDDAPNAMACSEVWEPKMLQALSTREHMGVHG